MKKIFIYFLLILFLSACSSVKRVKDTKYLLTQNTIIVNDKKNNNTDLTELLVQKPNSKTLGLPLSLYFYNLGDNNKAKKASDWATQKPKTYNFIKNIFSFPPLRDFYFYTYKTFFKKKYFPFSLSLFGLFNFTCIIRIYIYMHIIEKT